MKKILFVINDHPEVGKSSVSAAIRGYLNDQGFNTSLVAVTVGPDDLSEDRPPIHDHVWDLAKEKRAKKLLGWAEKHDVVVCDVETGAAPALIEMYQKYDLDLDFSEMDIELTIVAPEVEEADCHEEICNLRDAFSDHADYVVARVPRDEFGSSLEAWEDCEAFEEMAYMGAVIVEIPRVTDSVSDRLEEHELSTAVGLATAEEDLPEELAGMIRDWRRRFRIQMDDAADYLHPAASRRGLHLAATG